MEDATPTLDAVREYYGQELQGTQDLKTTACCPAGAPDPRIQAILDEIDDEILSRFYGCGSPLPPALEGCTVLDLGCGTGRDAYVASRLVGEEGRVIGLDMTEEQLAVARRHVDAQTQRFGYNAPNVDFRYGYIEDLAAAGIEDDSVDVVISNCVLNLSPDKRAAFAEIFRVLKPGGELYFSDIFADRRLPDAVAADPVLRGECLGGALYEQDFRRLLGELGCSDYRCVSQNSVDVEDANLKAALGDVHFTSRTIRAFNIAALEDRCEDYGQVADYRGGLDGAQHSFVLDDHHVFEKGRPMRVCANSAAMLAQTRYGKYFRVKGDTSVHYGLFDCSDPAPSSEQAPQAAGGCC